MRKICWAAPALAVLAISACAGAQAQGRPPAGGSAASTLAPHWNHNGSVVSIVRDGTKQKIFYDTPRIGLIDAGVKPGTLLFDGRRNGKSFVGTAYQFYRTCKSRGYQVSGEASEDLRQITLKGKAPLLDANCKVTGSRDDVLVFTANQSAPAATAQAPKVAEPANNPVVVGAIAPSAPPATVRTPDIAAAERSSAKTGDGAAPDKAASGGPTVAPSNAAKVEQPVKTPEQESGKNPPSDAAKETQQAAVPQNVSNAASSAATGSTAAPPSEPAKENQAGTTAGADSKPPKADEAKKADDQAQRAAVAPPGEPPKDTQVAAITEAASSAKLDDAGKAKNAAAAGGANGMKVASKSEVPGIDADKAAALAASKTAAANSTEKMMEIVLKNGRVLRIGRDIESEALLRIISLLER